LYDAKANVSKLIPTDDIRGFTGTQEHVRDAAVNLLYVADASKMDKMASEEKALWIGADMGVIAENVYFYCTAETSLHGISLCVYCGVFVPSIVDF
jgi:hypothetical protein